jgi:hypothetical protein
MKCRILLLLIALILPATCFAQLVAASTGATIHLVASPSSLNVPDATASTATISISATRSGSGEPLTITAQMSDTSVGGVTVTPATIGGTAGVVTVSITVSKDVTPGDYSLAVAGTDGSGTAQMTVPIHVGSDAFSIVFGLGSLITDSAGQDYKVQNDTLIATSVGRSRPELNLGAAFRIKIPTPSPAGTKYPWSAFVSLRVAPGADKAVSGYVFGASYRVSKYLDALIGFSLSPTNEPSVGFRNAAIQVVQNNPTLDIYKRFVSDNMLHNRPGAFDGFPLAVQSATGPTAQRVFPTDPFVTHYRGGFFVGIAFPFSFKAKLLQ